jgi:hypothetical protein
MDTCYINVSQTGEREIRVVSAAPHLESANPAPEGARDSNTNCELCAVCSKAVPLIKVKTHMMSEHGWRVIGKYFGNPEELNSRQIWQARVSENWQNVLNCFGLPLDEFIAQCLTPELKISKSKAWLGDIKIKSAVARRIMKHYPEMDVGIRTQLLGKIVSNENMSDFMMHLGIRSISANTMIYSPHTLGTIFEALFLASNSKAKSGGYEKRIVGEIVHGLIQLIEPTFFDDNGKVIARWRLRQNLLPYYFNAPEFFSHQPLRHWVNLNQKKNWVEPLKRKEMDPSRRPCVFGNYYGTNLM